MKLTFLCSAFAAIAGIAFAQQSTLYVPQVADGGGWQTTFVLTNRTVNPAAASLSFRSDFTAGSTSTWTPSFLEVSSTSNIVVSAGSTMYLHTTGTAATLTQGYAVVNADAGIAAHAIFAYTKAPGDTQQGTSIAAPTATRMLVPFDNTAGLISSVGLVNVNASNILVNIKTADGTISHGSLSGLPPNGHIAFLLSQQFPATAGQSGLAEFYSTSGNFSLLAELFTPTLSFTTSPVYLESGAPIISSGTASGTVTFGAGVRLVGTAIPPGRYYSAPAAGCYWERESGLGGTLAEIIANDFIASPFVQALVDIAPTDIAFSTNASCGTWTNIRSLGVQTGVPTGTWLVGAQVTPGIYQTQAASGCYWERLSNFGGLPSAIIANDFVSSAGPQLVSIAATDTGFTTESSCGSWTRLSTQAGSVSAQSPDEIMRNRRQARGK
jgi:hypothetical protein